MNLSSVRHSFVLKKYRNKEKSAIYHRLILVVNGKKVKTLEISSRLTVLPKSWDGKIIGKSNTIREQNEDLENQRAQIKNLFRTEVTSPNFDPEIFKMLVQAKVMGIDHVAATVEELQKPITIGRLFNDFLSNHESELCKRRVKLYKFVHKQLQGDLLERYGRKDIEMELLRRDDFIKFQNKLRKGRQKNTVSSYLKALKAVVNDAVKSEKITHSPFISCITGFEDGKRIALSVDELQQIVDIPESELTPRENVSRWVFIFACFTGLAYQDLVMLEEDMIEKRHDGIIINITRTKTNADGVIPRNPELESILDMFTQFHAMQKYERRLLPVPSYNKYNNEDLKVIQSKAGIRKNISTHIARHTFACHWLRKGGSYEALSKILAHKKISTTQIYGKVGTERVIEESKTVYSGDTLTINQKQAKASISKGFLQKHITGKKVHGKPTNADKISSNKKKIDGRAIDAATRKGKSPK